MKIKIRKSNRRRINRSGFRARMKTSDGRKVINRRRRKGRHCVGLS